MSPVAAGLDLLLVALLIVALIVGLRLNKRLKALRDSQLSFVKAVGELDTAAARAEAGLKALRIASEETHDILLTRIETARGLIARLESASDTATRAAAALTAPDGTTASANPVSPPLRFEARPDRPIHAPRPLRPAPVAARGLDDDLFESDPPVADRFQRRTERR